MFLINLGLGLPECSSDDFKDSDCSQSPDIVKSVSCDTEGIVAVNRNGKLDTSRQRHLKVNFKYPGFCDQLLRRAKNFGRNVKYKDVFINPDRTAREQRQFKASLNERKSAMIFTKTL